MTCKSMTTALCLDFHMNPEAGTSVGSATPRYFPHCCQDTCVISVLRVILDLLLYNYYLCREPPRKPRVTIVDMVCVRDCRDSRALFPTPRLSSTESATRVCPFALKL